MFENETSQNTEEKSSNRHKKGSITCIICGKTYIAEQRTLNNRYIRYGDNYCKDCAPKQYKMTKKHLDQVKNIVHKKSKPARTITIKSGKELSEARCKDNICYTCELCHKALIRKCKNVRLTYSRYNKLICPSCAHKNMAVTEEDRLRGVENRRKNTLERYGVEHTSQLPEVRVKMSESMKNRAKTVKTVDKENRRKKADKTAVERYGSRDAMYQKAEENREKTNMERYGVKSTLSIGEIRDRIKATSIERYGMEVASNNLESRKASKTTYRGTCLERYGVGNYMKTEMYRKVMHDKCRYIYKGIEFGSRWTLCFYIYYEELGKTVEFDVPEYRYKNERGKECIYRPDFRMDGKIYDVRGDTYYYGGKRYEDFVKSNLYKVIEENNIKVVTLDEISMYYEYIEWRWGGLDYIEQFKVEK